MPEVVIPDHYADQIPRFTLPPELTNKPDVSRETPKTEVKTAEPPKEAKPATEAVATPPVEEEPGKETTEKGPEKDATRRFERRIDRAHRQRAEALARADQLEQRLALLEQAQPVVSTNKPRASDFTDIEDFEKAIDKFAREEAVKEYETKQRNDANKSAQLRLSQQWEEKVSRGVSKYDDWDEVVGDLKPTIAMNVALMEEENGEDIAHHLGKNRKEVDRIMSLSPGAQFREIGKLSVRLSQKVAEPKTPSKAPPPIAPITGAAAVSDDSIKPSQPFEEYMKIGNKMFRGR